MGIGQVITMPLFFASSAIYPISVMPGWLKILARIHPLTYEVDGLRALMPQGSSTSYGLGLDSLILIVVAAVFVALGSWLYPRAAQ